ncbi:MAG: 3-isopropylmalate dehydratase small subunit [Proteobacteria bacterium]|nr:3-isopropylmalate dehydratase small subunit [Pseudomonadota bacterium]
MKDKISGIAAQLLIDNIDTDQIIPTEFLKSIKKYGFGDYLFDGWRYLKDGDLDTPVDQRGIREDFILNQPPYNQAKILLAGDNFGCGSSREHAVWALRDFGIEAVLATSFGDIFYNNCFKNNVLAIKLKPEEFDKVSSFVGNDPFQLSISLANKQLEIGDQKIIFDIEDSLIQRVIHDLDDVDITLKDSEAIKAFEIKHLTSKPWL